MKVVDPGVTAKLEQERLYKSSCLRNSRQVTSAKDTAPSTFFRVNIVLMLLVLISIFSYLFLSNFLVSQKYILDLRKQKLNQLNAELTTESMQKTGRIEDLLSFVRASGMVEAKDVSAVIEESGFALSENRY